MDTVIIFVLIGYEGLAVSWRTSRIRYNPPLVTEILMAGGRLGRWAFVIGLMAVMVDHLSLVNVPWL